MGSPLRLAMGMAAALLGAAAFPPGLITPAAAPSWSISLTASATDVAVGSTVTLTATASQSISGTQYYIDIADQTTNSRVDFCSTGRTCRVPVSWNGAGSHTYVAYVD